MLCVCTFGEKIMKRTALISFLLFLTLVSCSKPGNDPLSLAHFFDNKDFEVKMFVDDEEIRNFAKEFEISARGIYCVISVVPDNGNDFYRSGIYMYFDDADVAKDTTNDLYRCADTKNFSKNVISFTIKQSENLVFIGCENACKDSK